jgi:hypothetical protein
MSKMKPKGLKFKKKRMDIDAFIESELNNLNVGSAGNTGSTTTTKPVIKLKGKGPSLAKPTFASK